MLWHVNIRGPQETIYEGVVFHALMRFTERYPLEAPTITLCTRMEHPNVVDSNRICLDFLNAGEWKPIYSVHSILMQLQTFLYDGADVGRVLSSIQDPKTFEEQKEAYLSAQEWSMSHAKKYTHRKVGHSNHLPYPPFVSEQEEDAFKRMNCQSIENVIFNSNCFFTKTSQLIGYGVNCKKRNAKSIEICSLTCSLEILSLRAFMNYQVRGVSKEKLSFNHWIPIISSETRQKDHVEKVLHLAKLSISNMCSSVERKIDFSPDTLLKILPPLMSNCLLQTLDTREKSSNSFVACLRIFKLMEELIKHIPQTGNMINTSIGSFLQNENDRSKEKIDNLLNFLILIPFSQYSWKNLYEKFVREFFTRHVKKILKNYKEIADIQCTEINDDDRLNFSFKTIRKRLKELLLHIYFVDLFEKFDSIQSISKWMDENCGVLPYRSIDSFIDKLNQIEKMNDMTTFFSILNEMSSVQLFNTRESVIELLLSSINSSLQKGYHGQPRNKIKKPIKLEELPKHTNQELWKISCHSRWRIFSLPYYMQNMKDAWEQLYLQKSLSETLKEMIKQNDFTLLSNLLEKHSRCKCLEIDCYTSNPHNMLSKIFQKLSEISTIVFRSDIERNDEEGESLFRSLFSTIKSNGRKIENLIFHKCKIKPNHLYPLRYMLGFTKLEVLDFRKSKIGDLGAGYVATFLGKLSNCTNLTYLDLSYCNIGERGTKLIADSLLAKKNLKTFRYSGNCAFDGLNSIAYSLSYSYTIENLQLGDLKSDSNAETMAIHSSEHFANLFSESITLKKIDMSKLNVKQIITKISQMYLTTLEELDLEGNACSPNHYEGLFRWKTVRNKLNISNNSELTNESLNNLIESLVKYQGGWNNVSTHKKFITLNELNLSGNYLHATSPEKAPLGIILKYSTITRLDISNCSLQCLDLDIIAEALLMANVPRLKHLVIRQNKFKRHDLRPLLLPLQEITTLETLDISGNPIGEIGCRYISSIMKKNKSVKYLNMFGCFIDFPGVSCILESLKENETLEILDLGLNRVRNKGFALALDFLENNSQIKMLSLSHNNLDRVENFTKATEMMNQRPSLWINLKKNRLPNRYQRIETQQNNKVVVEKITRVQLERKEINHYLLVVIIFALFGILWTYFSK